MKTIYTNTLVTPSKEYIAELETQLENALTELVVAEEDAAEMQKFIKEQQQSMIDLFTCICAKETVKWQLSDDHSIVMTFSEVNQ